MSSQKSFFNMRAPIASLKITLFITLSLLTIPLQTLGLILFGKSRFFYIIPTSFYGLTCAIFGVRMQLSGDRAEGHVVYVGNHLSYIDIAVVGAKLNATFISKAEVKKWPVLGLLATVGKTVFIERSRNAAEKGIHDIHKTLEQGRSLILFPEGTSTDGTQVLPFKSTLFELFLSEKIKKDLIIQPFTLTLETVNGHKVTTQQDRDLYAWYGDMEFWPHLWQLAKSRGVAVQVAFHPPHKAENYHDRKDFANACHKDVAQGLENTLSSTLDFQPEAA